MRYDVAVIGGGAAGLMAAGTAVKAGKKVALIEKNRVLAKKVRITGKGRCNVTNICDAEEFLENVLNGKKFLYSAFSKFSNYDCIAFFEDLGVPMKTERGGRVFPVSDSAHDVAQALIRYAEGAEILRESRVLGIEVVGGKASGVRLASGVVAADSVIIATGGLSYPGTGSTGDGYKWAEDLGHKVVTPKGSLVPLEVAEEWVAELEGLSLRNVGMKLVSDKGIVYENRCGEMLFTSFGVSGPLVLSVSAHLGDINGGVKMVIDLKPALSEEVLDARLLRDFGESANKDFVNIMPNLVPRRLVARLVEMSGIDPRKKANQVTRQERTNLVRCLKGIELTVTGMRPISEAIVTAGGVDLGEINPSTMESKLVEGLFFAGEVMDLDAYTGGFNLQIAFSTGFVAGMES